MLFATIASDTFIYGASSTGGESIGLIVPASYRLLGG
jgi:hypothetical protein